MGNFFSNNENYSESYFDEYDPSIINRNLKKLIGGNKKLSHFSELTHDELSELSLSASSTSTINLTQQMEMNMVDSNSAINTQMLNKILDNDNIQQGGGSDDDSIDLLSTTNSPMNSSNSDINELMQTGGYNSDSSKDGSSISISSN